MLTQFKAIIFDCDGVIIDTETISNQLMHAMFQELGLHLDKQTIHDRFTGFTTQDNLATAENMLGRALPEDFEQKYKQRFHDAISTSLAPIEGIPELLNKLSCPIAMATNAKRQEMDYKLSLIEMTHYFPTRFCVEDVANGKPAPDLYLKAASALGFSPEECLVVEDSLAGIQAGSSAGCTVLAYSAVMNKESQKAAGATATFSSMKELMSLLGL